MGENATAMRTGQVTPGARRWWSAAPGILRTVVRCAGFALALTLAAVDYARVRFLCRHLDQVARRALWLHRLCRVLTRVIGMDLRHSGAPPDSGLIVSNHLSYLDIIAYSALVPCVFIAKSEVARWPIFGRFARMAGSVFVDRTRRMKVADANRLIADVLTSGAVVILFAEGTSSDGRTVLPFRSSLLESVAVSLCPVIPAAIGYELSDGSVAEEVCYWGDMTLLPHLLNLFSKRTIRTRVAFGCGGVETIPSSRKEAAQMLHRQVSELHASLERREG